ncbi:Osteoclast-stimulating factor 1, partial [Balamuthia mandrillaris]
MQPQGATPWRKRGGQPSPFLGSSSAALWHNEEEGPEHAASVRSTSSRRAKGPRGRGGRGTQPQPSQEQPPTTNTTTGGSPPQRQQRHNSQSPKRTSPQGATAREQASLFGSGKRERRWGRGKGSGGNGGGSGGSGGGNGGKVMKQNSFVAEIKCYKEDLVEYDETEGQKAEAEGKRRGRRGGRDNTNRNNKKAGTEPTTRAKLAQRRRVSTPLLATPHVTPEQALQEFSPLHMAARRGNLDMLNALLARGENPSSKSFGCTPLHWAAFEGHARCVERLLLVKDIEVDELEPEERTP